MFKLEIESPVDMPRDTYAFHIYTYSGDMDDYHDLRGSGSKEELERVLTIVTRMKKAYPHGRGGGDSYADIKGFVKFDEAYEWPRDGYDYIEDTPYWCDVVYYDLNGIKYKVKVNDKDRHFF